MVVKCLFLLAFAIGLAYAQTEESLLPKNFTLPPELEGKIDQEALGAVQNKSKEAFKKKCEQNGGPDAFGKAENAFTNFIQCVQGIVDTDVLQREIEDAKPNGTVDEVFQKYCKKTPVFTNCFNTLEQATNPCFADEERKNMKTVHNVTEQLVNFICYKEGDRIALFIAEGGQECFQEKRPELEACANKTLDEDVSFKVDNIATGDVPTLSFDEKQCGKIALMQECTVKVLETCEKPTSANIVESLFKFIRKVTPCKEFMDKGDKGKSKAREQKSKTNSANALPVAVATVAMGLLAAVFV